MVINHLRQSEFFFSFSPFSLLVCKMCSFRLVLVDFNQTASCFRWTFVALLDVKIVL